MQVTVYDSRIVPRDLYLELRLIEERGIRLRRSRQSRFRRMFAAWWTRSGAGPTAA
ncbi:MAG: hypothetical protein PHU53_04680 [Thermoplasmata archaeon]|nr:hypothetical protein [Thermoplasmata archaeon]